MAQPIQNKFFIPPELLAQLQAQVAYLQSVLNGTN